MRVIAGTAKSLPLRTPEGMETRPTTDRIKETLFNMLQPWIPGCVFLDLFSGSGAIGIEALSRGAAKCYFVESNKKAQECIRANLEFTRLSENAVLIGRDILTAVGVIEEEKADLIFLDPPYQEKYEERVLAALAGQRYVTEETRIIVEASLKTDFVKAAQLGYTVTKEKKYKTNKHVFLTRR